MIKFNLMKKGAWAELQQLGTKLETVETRRRLLVEKQWVQSLLRMCRRKVDPDDFHRWQEKYEDDCRWLRKCESNS